MQFCGFFSVNLIFEILRSYMLLILPSFLYFDKGRRSYPRASCDWYKSDAISHMSCDKNLMDVNSVYKGCNFVIWGQISWKCHLALHCVFFCLCSSLQIGGTKWQDINFILSLVMKITHNIIKSDVKSVTFSAYLSSVIWMILPFRNIGL